MVVGILYGGNCFIFEMEFIFGEFWLELWFSVGGISWIFGEFSVYRYGVDEGGRKWFWDDRGDMWNEEVECIGENSLIGIGLEICGVFVDCFI